MRSLFCLLALVAATQPAWAAGNGATELRKLLKQQAPPGTTTRHLTPEERAQLRRQLQETRRSARKAS